MRGGAGCQGKVRQSVPFTPSPNPTPSDSLTRDEVTTQTSDPAAGIRHDGISNWPIELKGQRWSSQRETKNIDHLKEERGN